jgi:hypothetical protein
VSKDRKKKGKSMEREVASKEESKNEVGKKKKGKHFVPNDCKLGNLLGE